MKVNETQVTHETQKGKCVANNPENPNKSIYVFIDTSNMTAFYRVFKGSQKVAQTGDTKEAIEKYNSIK